METAALQLSLPVVRAELVDRRDRLTRVISDVADPAPLVRLLGEVDRALADVDAGTFGLCEVCHDAIEAERIVDDPLIRTCLGCLSDAQRRALERDLDLASRVQRLLLPPETVRVDGWEAAYIYQPAGVASGDYIDLVPLDSGDLIFLVGDVSGKGLAASMLMTHLHATVRSLVNLRLPFEELLARTNRMFYDSVGANQYATLLVGRAATNGDVTIANAGHCPPVVLGSERAAVLPPTSVPIGLFADAPFPTEAITLARGDTLIVYTDGVSEATDPAGHEYGAERLIVAAARRGLVAPRALVDDCLADLERFRGAAERCDDVTLFALRRSHGQTIG